MQSKKKPHTLSDADITSGRSVSRRSLLGIIAIGATAAAVVTAASGTGAVAAKLKGKTPRKKGVDIFAPIGDIKGESGDQRRRARPGPHLRQR
jgi:hypothetical protein